MEVRSNSICIKEGNLVEVDRIVSHMKIRFRELLEDFNIKLQVQDLSEDFRVMSNFLKENQLQDENPFFNEFDINSYGIMINFIVLRDFRHIDFFESIVFFIGNYLSVQLDSETLVMFDNLKIPVAQFKKGMLVSNFSQFNRSYFADKIWLPNKNIMAPSI